MGTNAEAVEALVDLGFTEYEARCFVALTQLSEGTAKEISQIAEVPQSRVHDVAEQLHRRGVVDVQASEPRRYNAVPVDQALDRLREDYTDTLGAARERLEALDARDTDSDGVWEVADQEDVVARLRALIADATEEVYLVVADDQLLDCDLLEALERAAADGVRIYAEVPTAAARETVHEAVPAAKVARTPLPLESLAVEDCTPGRLVLVDRETVLLSALSEGLVPGQVAETGLWGSEAGHGLVLWLQPLLSARLDDLEFEASESA